MFSPTPITLCLFCMGMLALSAADSAMAGSGDRGEKALKISVVYNNIAHDPGPQLQTAWGFACLIQGLDQTILFDTGGDAAILLANLRRLGLDTIRIDAIVLSHEHADHTGGLGAVLSRQPEVIVYLPASFPDRFHQLVRRHGARAEIVSGSRQLLPSVYSTGEMGSSTQEQGLILDLPGGLILITGCAHPNVAAMVERAVDYLDKPVQLVMGGFHLAGSSEAEIRRIITGLQALGVTKVAPSHCTGEDAIRLFRAAWGEDFISGGLGAVIELPLSVAPGVNAPP